MNEKCPNCGGEMQRRPEGLFHKGPGDTWIRMSAGGWQSCLEKQLVVMAERAKVAEAIVEKLLAHCPDAECMECAAIICPHGDEMHFHHDGCPSCSEAAQAAKE